MNMYHFTCVLVMLAACAGLVGVTGATDATAKVDTRRRMEGGWTEFEDVQASADTDPSVRPSSRPPNPRPPRPPPRPPRPPPKPRSPPPLQGMSPPAPSPNPIPRPSPTLKPSPPRPKPPRPPPRPPLPPRLPPRSRPPRPPPGPPRPPRPQPAGVKSPPSPPPPGPSPPSLPPPSPRPPSPPPPSPRPPSPPSTSPRPPSPHPRSPRPPSPRPPVGLPSPSGRQPPPTPPTPRKPPNFIFILTDDQDEMYDSTAPKFMPALNRLIGDAGTRMSNFVITTAVCCPARTSLLTGKMAHCTNVTSNYYPSGGFQKFMEQGLDQSWLPTRLEAAGYDTLLLGKFLNQYFTSSAPPDYKPAGFTNFEALTVNAYNLTNSCFAINGGRSTCYPKDYQTDLIRDKAKAYISSSVYADRPFFAYLTPTAPHRVTNNGAVWRPPTPAERHKDLYEGENITVPRGLNWGVRNPSIPRKGSAVPSSLKFQEDMDALFLARQRSLRAIDEMIESLVIHLEELGVLDNTYVIYMSDNGYHMGAFSLYDGKNLPIEEDIRVPFYIRGPGIPAGQILPHQSTNVDIAPTLLALAGLPIPDDMDGLPLALPQLRPAYTAALRGSAAPATTASGKGDTAEEGVWLLRDTTILEGWNGDGSDNDTRWSAHYKALRVCTNASLLFDSAPSPVWAARGVYAPGVSCYKYTVWCQGAKELVDMASDPYELRNRVFDAAPRITDRLDAVLSALVHCSGASCRNPYSLLHPDGAVRTFSETLNPRYDAMYQSLIPLNIKACTKFYILSNEVTWTQGVGPQPTLTVTASSAVARRKPGA